MSCRMHDMLWHVVTSCGSIVAYRFIASWQPSPGHCSCVWGFADVLGVQAVAWNILDMTFPMSCFHFSSFFNAICKKLQVTDWAFSTFSFISFCIRFIFIVFFLTWEAAFVRQGTHSLRRRARSCVMWFQGSGRRKPTFSILSRQKPSTRRWLQLFPLIWSIL